MNIKDLKDPRDRDAMERANRAPSIHTTVIRQVTTARGHASGKKKPSLKQIEFSSTGPEVGSFDYTSDREFQTGVPWTRKSGDVGHQDWINKVRHHPEG